MLSQFQALIFLTRIFTVVAMTAVIWFVQVVTYPQFLQIGPEEFRGYHRDYSSRVSLIVIPLMFIELVTAFVAIPVFHRHKWRTKLMFGSILTVLTWIVTFTVQVPIHNELASNFSAETVKSLGASNWIRTCLWTLHSALLIFLVWKATTSKTSRKRRK